MAASAQTTSAFPSPYDIAMPPGCEGWQEMYYRDGLPAVVGTGRAAAEIWTGQLIRVDGSTGVVTILDA